MQTTTYLAIAPDELHRIVSTAVAEALAAQTPPPALPSPDADHMLTREEVCRMLHLSRVTLRNLELRGELIPKRIARRVLYRKADVLAALDRRTGRGKR
jgi:hypothetical protein